MNHDMLWYLPDSSQHLDFWPLGFWDRSQIFHNMQVWWTHASWVNNHSFFEGGCIPAYTSLSKKTIKNILYSRTSRTINKQNLWKRCKKIWHFPPNLYCLPTFVTHQHWSFPFQVSNHMPGGWSIATGQGCPLTFIFQCHTVKANASSTFTALLWRKSPANPKLEQSYLKMVWLYEMWEWYVYIYIYIYAYMCAMFVSLYTILTNTDTYQLYIRSK